MSQLAFESLLSEGAGSMRYLAGYSWTMPEEIRPYVHGVVATPRWVDRAVKEFKWDIMLDNGAFPAFRDGVDLCPVVMLKQMKAAVARHPARIRWLIAPDKVAGGLKSWTITRHAVAKMRPWAEWRRVLLPVQEGQDLEAVARFAKSQDCDLFIGGATYEFKRYAADQLRKLSPGAYIHVGRIWKDGDLHFHSSRVESFDNTTYCRAQHFNTRIDIETLGGRYLERNEG